MTDKKYPGRAANPGGNPSWRNNVPVTTAKPAIVENTADTSTLKPIILKCEQYL
jgi:hypothetical protein